MQIDDIHIPLLEQHPSPPDRAAVLARFREALYARLQRDGEATDEADDEIEADETTPGDGNASPGAEVAADDAEAEAAGEDGTTGDAEAAEAAASADDTAASEATTAGEASADADPTEEAAEEPESTESAEPSER